MLITVQKQRTINVFFYLLTQNIFNFSLLYFQKSRIVFIIYSISKLLISRTQLRQYSVWLRAGRPDDRGSIPGRGKGIFPLSSVSRPALGPTQRPVQWVPGVLSPGGKARPRRDADHSPPSSAEVVNE
jgi:hypothetical protein